MVKHRLTRLLRVVAPALLVTSVFGLLPASADEPAEVTRFMIRLADPGVYRVTWEHLRQAGLEGPTPTNRMALYRGPLRTPLWIEDGGDGTFGPGDHATFVAQHLAGDHSWYSEHSPYNVYALDTRAAENEGYRSVTAGGDGICHDRTRLTTERHYEQDLLRMRFDEQDSADEEVWYWHKLTHIDDEPFTQIVDLSDLENVPGQPVRLRMHLRGWSRLPVDQRGELADHRVEVRVGDRLIGGIEWNNTADGQLLEIAEPIGSFAIGDNRLTLTIPPRQGRPVSSDDDDPPPVIDVVLVNWLEISYTRNTAIDSDQTVAAPLQSADCIDLQTDPGARLTVYRDDGLRIDAGRGHPATGNHKLPLSATTIGTAGWTAGRPLHLVRDDAYAEPLEVRPGRALDPADRDQTDYVMIAHPRLIDATRPLADHYRANGMTVRLLDVTRIYDTFSGGVVHPAAIRDYLRHAWEHWSPPKPRYVLLVGDASWDNHHDTGLDRTYADKVYRYHHATRLPKNRSTAYQGKVTRRNLVPTYSAGTRDGLAANDSWFADVEGDRGRPEMAVGRFPVVTPEEVTDIVNKSIAYADTAPVGPWRRRMLWITNEAEFSRQRSDRLAATMSERGYAASKVYPNPDEPSNESNRLRLIEAFDAGNLLVHFFGHGGRYIWRTGPPDREKNHDLFTLDDLESLTPNPRLPVVLSMTCYSAPFDHPEADSIGEKFLRLPDRGAIAVIAAAWRNSPSLEMSMLLLDTMTRPGTIGDAFLNAKRKSTTRDFLTQYNLLGDPGVPIPVPAHTVEIEFDPSSAGRIRAAVEGKGRKGFRGRGIVDWLNAQGDIVHSEEVPVSGPRLQASLPMEFQTDGSVSWVRVYLWDAESATDALGVAAIPEDPS